MFESERKTMREISILSGEKDEHWVFTKEESCGYRKDEYGLLHPTCCFKYREPGEDYWHTTCCDHDTFDILPLKYVEKKWWQ